MWWMWRCGELAHVEIGYVSVKCPRRLKLRPPSASTRQWALELRQTPVEICRLILPLGHRVAWPMSVAAGERGRIFQSISNLIKELCWRNGNGSGRGGYMRDFLVQIYGGASKWKWIRFGRCGSVSGHDALIIPFFGNGTRMATQIDNMIIELGGRDGNLHVDYKDSNGFLDRVGLSCQDSVRVEFHTKEARCFYHSILPADVKWRHQSHFLKKELCWGNTHLHLGCKDAGGFWKLPSHFWPGCVAMRSQAVGRGDRGRGVRPTGCVSRFVALECDEMVEFDTEWRPKSQLWKKNFVEEITICMRVYEWIGKRCRAHPIHPIPIPVTE